MPDIATVWPPGGLAGDWAFSSADLVSGQDLQTAVAISLFTDRLASADDVIPDGSDDPRGWADDTTMGSGLWLLSRSVLTDKVRLAAEDAIRAALQWMLDDGVASALTVAASIGGPRRLDVLVVLTRTGGQPIKLQFAWAWGG